MAEPVSEQVQNLNLSGQDSGTANGDSEADQFENIMADTEAPTVQDDPSMKHTSNGDTQLDPSKGNMQGDDLYMEDSGDEDDDFEYSKSENSEQRVPMSFGDNSAYSEQKNNVVDPGAQQFDGFQPFFPQGYQEEITPPKNQESLALIDDGSASQIQGQISDISDPLVSNEGVLMELDRQNEPMDSQPANMQDMNPFLDTQNSQMYSSNPFMDDFGGSAGYENQQVVPEGNVPDSGAGLSQTPDLLLIGESCQQMSHDTQVLSNQSLSDTNGFDKAQNVIDSVAQESDTNVPVSEISPSVPEIAICDDQSESLVSPYDQEFESHDQEIESHDQEIESHDQEYQSQEQEFESQKQEYKPHVQEFESHDQAEPQGQEYESHDQEFEAHDKSVPGQEFEPHVREFQTHDQPEPQVQEFESHDQEFEAYDKSVPQGQEFEPHVQEFETHDQPEPQVQEFESHDQEVESYDQDDETYDQDFESHDQDIEPHDYMSAEMVEKAENIQSFGQPERKVVDFEETRISKQIESPEEDMTERCMGLIEPTQIVPEEETAEEPLQEMADSDSEIDQRYQSPDDYQQYPKQPDIVPAMEGSIPREGSQGFETEQYFNDVGKPAVNGSSSEPSSESQPPVNMRETGMSGSLILESGQTFDTQQDGFPDEASKSLTQESSDEGEAEELEEVQNQLTRSAMEDSIILDEGEAFDEQLQVGAKAEDFAAEQQMESVEQPQTEMSPSASDGSVPLDDRQAEEIPSEMSRSLMEGSIVLGEGETFDDMQVSDERARDSELSQEEQNVENDYIPQNGPQQNIPDIHYQSYDSQSGEIIETSREVAEGEDYIDDISSEESQDHLETSQHLAEEVSEHKDFTHRHPSELEVQKEMDQGYFEQKEELDTPGEIEDELYEQEHGQFDEQHRDVEMEVPVVKPGQSEMPQQAETAFDDLGYDEQQFRQICEPEVPVPVVSASLEQEPEYKPEPEPQLIPDLSAPEPSVPAPEPKEPLVQTVVEESLKEVVEKESAETKVSEDEQVKKESISEITKVTKVKDGKETPKKTVKSAEKKKEEKTKTQKTESVTKKDVSSKVTQKTTTRKPKPAPSKEEAGKIPSPTKTSSPRPASTLTTRSPTKPAEPAKPKPSTPRTPRTGTSAAEKPTPKSTSTPRRPVSADVAKQKNAIPLRKSLPSPVKNGTADKTQVSPTKRETTPRLPARPKSTPQPRTKKDVSSDSGVEEDKTTRKTTTTVTQKKKLGGTTVTTQKTTTTTVKKTEVKNGPTADSRKSSPGTRSGVASKVGSLDNARHSPGGGNVKITTKKTDYSTVGSRIGSKANLVHKPGGGEKKILTQKLEWKTGSRIGSLDNAKHSPGGGNVKIESKKLEFDKVQSRVGSKDNIKHQPGGGEKKIESQKLEFREKASSKVGSKDNIGHQATGGEKKIETHKLNFREKAKPKTDTGGSSPHPGPKSPPPENGVAEQTAAE